jgi:hypothetical protein
MRALPLIWYNVMFCIVVCYMLGGYARMLVLLLTTRVRLVRVGNPFMDGISIVVCCCGADTAPICYPSHVGVVYLVVTNGGSRCQQLLDVAMVVDSGLSRGLSVARRSLFVVFCVRAVFYAFMLSCYVEFAALAMVRLHADVSLRNHIWCW